MMIINQINYSPSGELKFIDNDGKNVTGEVILHFENGELISAFDQSYIEIPEKLWGYREVYLTDRSGDIILFDEQIVERYFTNQTEEKIQYVFFHANFMYVGIYPHNVNSERKINENVELFFENNELGIKLPYDIQMPFFFEIHTTAETHLVNFRKKENNSFLIDLASIDIDTIERIYFKDYQFNKLHDYLVYSRKQLDLKDMESHYFEERKVVFSENNGFSNLENLQIIGQLGTDHFEVGDSFRIDNNFLKKFKADKDQSLDIFAIRSGSIVQINYSIDPNMKESSRYYSFKNTIIILGSRRFTGNINQTIKMAKNLPIDVGEFSHKSVDLIFPRNILTLQIIISSKNSFFEIFNSVSGNISTIKYDNIFDDLGMVNGVKRINLFANVSFYGEKKSTFYKLQLTNNSKQNNKLFFDKKFPLEGGVGKYRQYVQIFKNKNTDLVILKGPLHNLVKNTFGWSAQVDSLKREGQSYRLVLRVSGAFFDEYSIKCVRMILRNVLNPIENDYITNITKKDSKVILVESIIDLNHEYRPFYWDLFLIIGNTSINLPIQVDKLSDNVKELIDVDVFKKEIKSAQENILYPYVTAGGSLAFTYRKIESYENEANFKKEIIAQRIYNLFRKYLDRKNIWIVFEKNSFGAHDNAFHFFKYMYENEKHPNTYYVIRKDSPEYKNMHDMRDKVLDYMSIKYFVYMFSAKLFISSDTKFHAYNLQRRDSLLAKSMMKKKNVFLQHGVNGIKKVPVFHKKRGLLDLIIAPSNFERENINMKQWGYSADEVIATGYSRWDSYIDKTSEISYHQIFMMPTWRKAMEGISREQFLNTTFYKEYQAFLKSPKLKEVLIKNNVRLSFFLHPYFKNYVDLFEIDEAFTDKYGYLDVDMGEEIMRSSMMISDYSSVTWDMFYLKKPVIFYQFDQEDYLKSEGTYLDYDKDLFGEVVFNSRQAVDAVIKYVENGFSENDKFALMRNKYMNFHDHKNSERIYKGILKKKSLLGIENKWTLSRRIFRKLWKLKKKWLHLSSSSN